VTIVLDDGTHVSHEEGMCLLEAVSYVAGEDFTDHPECVSLVLAEFGRYLNDDLPFEPRQQLIPLIPKLIGTVNPEQDQRDGLRCSHWLVTHWLPAWLDLVPELKDCATALRGLPEPKSWSETETVEWVDTIVNTDLVIDAMYDAQPTTPAPRPRPLNDDVGFAVSAAARVALRWDRATDAPTPSQIFPAAIAVIGAVFIALLTLPDEDSTHVAIQATADQLQQDTIDLFTELIEGRHR
jgi:hypothetical protein